MEHFPSYKAEIPQTMAFKLLPLVSLFVPEKWYIFFSPSNYYHWFHHSCQKNGTYFFCLQTITIGFTICARKMVYIFFAFKLLPLVSLFVPRKWYIFFSPSNYYHWFRYSCQKNSTYSFRLLILEHFPSIKAEIPQTTAAEMPYRLRATLSSQRCFTGYR